MLNPARRITTGINDKNESVVISEDSVSPEAPFPLFKNFELCNLFYTEQTPQSTDVRHLATPYDINIPEGALRVIRINMPTKQQMIEDLTAAGEPIPDDWSCFNLHATNSVDYIYILKGAVTCVTGTTQTELHAGDFLAQLGPQHTWINDHDEPCELLCIMSGVANNPVAQTLDIDT